MQIGRCPSHSHEIIKQYGNKEMPRKLFFFNNKYEYLRNATKF